MSHIQELIKDYKEPKERADKTYSDLKYMCEFYKVSLDPYLSLKIILKSLQRAMCEIKRSQVIIENKPDYRYAPDTLCGPVEPFN